MSIPPDIYVAPELVAIQEEISNQTDRGAAILAGSILSEFLGRKILEKFTPTSNRRLVKLFEGFGPLASFSARIEIGYSIGAIDDDDTYHDLLVIKDIRNEFAHSIAPMTFQSDQIVKLVKKLKLSVGPMDGYPNVERRLFALSFIECLLNINERGVAPNLA